ncbi:MAG: hypothetical protein II794_07500 [Oscillospiraceae bacterium]|nr:hypothetical protein [Oscillospiraceae bacterium]
MNSEELLLAMNDMEQELILDAQRLRPRPVKAWIAGALTAAAALALVFLAPWRVPADPVNIPMGDEPAVTAPGNHGTGETTSPVAPSTHEYSKHSRVLDPSIKNRLETKSGLFARFPASFEEAMESSEPILPPATQGKSIGKAQFNRGYTMKEAYEEADLVAVIRIGNWLGEEKLSEGSRLMNTYYGAQVVTTYKGESGDTIIYGQSGGSSLTWYRYLLHSYGDIVLAFFKYNSDGYYSSLCWYLGELNGIEDADGNLYFVDRFGMLSSGLDLISDISQKRDYAAEALLDDTVANPGMTLHAYSQDALEALFESYK